MLQIMPAYLMQAYYQCMGHLHTYKTWLEDELQEIRNLLNKGSSEVQKLRTQVLSYINLVEQERMYKESGMKDILDLEFYSGFSSEEIVQCFNLLQP